MKANNHIHIHQFLDLKLKLNLWRENTRDELFWKAFLTIIPKGGDYSYYEEEEDDSWVDIGTDYSDDDDDDEKGVRVAKLSTFVLFSIFSHT